MKKEKRKKIILLIGILLIIVIAVFHSISAPKVTTIDNVSMTIKNRTLSNKQATIVITNKSKKKCSFGEEYVIEKKICGKWFKIKEKNSDIWWELVGYEVLPNESEEFKINWTTIYGKLKKGKYRLVKIINDKRIAVEFNI